MITRIINDDSFKIIDEVISEVKNPVIVTDPPFNIGYHYKGYKDRLPNDVYFRMLAEMALKVPSVIVHYPESIVELSLYMSEVPTRIISWVYPSNTARQHRDIAFYRMKPNFNNVRVPYKNPNDKRVKELARRTGGAKMYDWIEVNQVKNVSKDKTEHPCQMPFELMQKVVKLLPDDVTVIDPFCGSGTTILACAYEGISSIGIEIDSLYASIAHDRLETEIGCGAEFLSN